MKISIVIPTYNEESNIPLIYDAILGVLEGELLDYEYEMIIIDNYSTDNTRDEIMRICSANKRVKAILNVRNFGAVASPFHGLCQTSGDCAVLLAADFQDPVDMIPRFVREWENGYKIVCGVKSSSQENNIMRFLRSSYYAIIKKMSSVEQIEHFTGFGLYDRSFIDVLRKLDDPMPYLRGIVTELGPKYKLLHYEQQKRKAGKSSFNLYGLYDVAMLAFTTYTKVGLRIATIGGFFFSFASLLVAFVYLLMKLLFWDRFQAGVAPAVLGVFVFGSLQLFFIGLIGEYILSINTRLMKRPLVIEERRVNFDKTEQH